MPDNRKGRTHWMTFMIFGTVSIAYRMFVDTITFFSNLFISVGEETVQEQD